MTTHALTPDIFKAYDVRGLYGREIDGDVAEEVGRAFVRVLAERAGRPAGALRIGLGHDMRLPAAELAERYRDGMVAEGAHVLDAGMIATEMLYWLVGRRSLDGGLMCTASHNPAAYTGAKLVAAGAVALSAQSGLRELRELLAAGLGTAPGGGSWERLDIYGEFHAAVCRLVSVVSMRPMTVVLDGGNGMAGPTAGPVLDVLPLEQVTMGWEPDGTFPRGHEPNPLLPENRRAVIAAVRATGAELGIAWDGDADRCFFVDDTGTFVDGDFITALLAQSVLAAHPGATIVYDVRSSRAVPDTVARLGGRALVNRVGHAFFKARMRAEGAEFGGEVSGHYYFRGFYNADSGTLPALLILGLLSRRGATLSELLAGYRARYFISGEINSEVGDPAAKLAELACRYADGRIDRLDGLSVDYRDWHFNVRPSNTEPLLRLTVESLVSRRDMEQHRDQLLEVIRS
ncbi:MAG TPA: phosphomannomutase/phosphoglucomutase [Solirubrobacteraceae bacterium]|jgi:phosphomannomutase